MKKIIPVLLVCLILTSAKPNVEYFKVHGELFIQRGQVANDTKIVLYQDGDQVRELKGKKDFKFDLRIGYDYTLVFSKEGYVSKTIEVLTFVPNKAPKSTYKSFGFDVSLFKEVEGLDLLIFNQPIAVVDYNTKSKKMGYNYNYTRGVKMEIKTAKDLVFKANNLGVDPKELGVKLLSASEEKDLNEWRERLVNEKIDEIQQINEGDIREKNVRVRK